VCAICCQNEWKEPRVTIPGRSDASQSPSPYQRAFVARFAKQEENAGTLVVTRCLVTNERFPIVVRALSSAFLLVFLTRRPCADMNSALVALQPALLR